MDPDDDRHGTYAGYQAHHNDGEIACGPCLAANRRYQTAHRRRKGKTTRTLVPISTLARIRARTIDQWTIDQINALIGPPEVLPPTPDTT